MYKKQTFSQTTCS